MKITVLMKTGLIGLLLSVLAGCQSAPRGLTAEQIGVLKEQGFRLTDEGWTLDFSNRVLFANDSEALNPGTRVLVEKLGMTLLGVGLNKARIDGHTDSNGPEAYNDQLSLKRAKSVADVLVSVGMQPANLDIRGRGQRDPVADNKTAAGRAENRRVGIIISNE
ncbi:MULTISPECIES: OmpA family protein [Aeromonas]|uniref:OmpA family protein n=1 Tax=bacterium 19CA06SA08-2 TaxID=2920658 RepID=A0AAU6U0U7_UNCXX|nr:MULTISPECIES: OmpA family protein [Aeromonas]MDF2390960.1 OmpA family protein [Aeromonas sp. 2MA4]MDM5101757.1 OmpA family protein [Aeromonas salmonicida]WCH25445.1 OmpA family protein [Aeromonas salmonicida]